MKIIVFGPTGGTGLQLVQQALDKGYMVTAVARNPAAISIQHPNLSIIKGDALQSSTFEKAIQNQDAVLSALGFKSTKDVMVYSQGVENITMAMERYGVERIVCVSAAAVKTNPKLVIFFRLLTKVLQVVFKKPYADLLKMEQHLKETNLNWTVVRPPRLTNGKATRKYRFAVNEWLPQCQQLSRADLAHFMLEHINDNDTHKSVIEVAN